MPCLFAWSIDVHEPNEMWAEQASERECEGVWERQSEHADGSQNTRNKQNGMHLVRRREIQLDDISLLVQVYKLKLLDPSPGQSNVTDSLLSACYTFVAVSLDLSLSMNRKRM